MLFWGQPNRQADWMDFFLVLETEEESSELLEGGRLACSSIFCFVPDGKGEYEEPPKNEKSARVLFHWDRDDISAFACLSVCTWDTSHCFTVLSDFVYYAVL